MAYLDETKVGSTDYDLRDKDLNAADAVTSVGSTDAVVLKGTDGSYHKIEKASFVEAVRGALGGILNNMTWKGNSNVKGIGVIDNSNDLGVTSASDLASVLGVRASWTGDCNTLMDGVRGTWFPSSQASQEAHFIALSGATNVIFETRSMTEDPTAVYAKVQTAYMNNGNTWRRFKNTDGSWGTWYRVDNYGTTSLSELASALGADYHNTTQFTLVSAGNTKDIDFAVYRIVCGTPTIYIFPVSNNELHIIGDSNYTTRATFSMVNGKIRVTAVSNTAFTCTKILPL